MKYAREVIELLAAYPGRPFRMAEIVRHVARGPVKCQQQRERYRKGVRRAIEALSEASVVQCHQGVRGQPARYVWHESGTRASCEVGRQVGLSARGSAPIESVSA